MRPDHNPNDKDNNCKPYQLGGSPHSTFAPPPPAVAKNKPAADENTPLFGNKTNGKKDDDAKVHEGDKPFLVQVTDNCCVM